MARTSEVIRDQNVARVSERLEPYLAAREAREEARPPGADAAAPVLDELAQRAMTFVTVMPPRQHRETIEELVSPNDPELGRRAIDALIEGALVTEDDRGCLLLR